MDLAGFRLHALTGDLKGLWPVTVRANCRVVFRHEAGDARDVDLIDYHLDACNHLGQGVLDVIEVKQQPADKKGVMLAKVAAEHLLSSCFFLRNRPRANSASASGLVVPLTKAARI